MSFSGVKKKNLIGSRLKVLWFPAALGLIKIVYSEKFLRQVAVMKSLSRDDKSKRTVFLKENLPDWLLKLVSDLRSYFRGEKVNFSPPIDLASFSPFCQQVYLMVQKIPYGETRSYKWVAGQIGNQKAVRAVGQALKNNPLLIVVPCHRVIKSDGSLGGWSGVEGLKEELLNLEKATKGTNSQKHRKQELKSSPA